MEAKMKNTYESPKALVVCLETTDVITASWLSDSDIIDDGWVEA